MALRDISNLTLENFRGEAARPDEQLPAISETTQQKPSVSGEAEAKHYPLESVEGLRLHNVTAVPDVLQGQKGTEGHENGHGGVALWLEPGTVAHFRNLT